MQHETITTDEQLRDYCRELAQSDSIAFDTEFVSEHTHRPVLCLIQVASQEQLAVIDTMSIGDVAPFWDVIAGDGHETIVHAGRSEVEFCLRAVGKRPAGLVDVQIAAGLAGFEFPAGFGTLISKVLGEKSGKHETRTDWRRRPLSDRQIQYALEDASYLHPLRERLHAKLSTLGRLEWLADEMHVWLAEVERAQSHQRWRRVSGSAGLGGRQLAVVRALWQWREDEAQRRDQPVRRILRDDLIVELARRATADPKRIRAVRGLERGDLRKRLDEIAKCIQEALDLPEEQVPPVVPHERTPQLSVLGQFLFAAMGSVCREADLAPNLVGTPNDIRELVAYRTQSSESPRRKVPKLARGWRAELVGHLFDDLLAGKKSVRIRDPNSDHPLIIDPS